ncbi:hypothetical protein DdX_09236 [Ditylenchus destructor]|uniref:Uncharacterized protein n=1 Tax=Ditylenchus destructor TaxID=166010 RepID=A0AAD4R3D6_9BILA|nr:hypothetical protein DdX_09236 [Ditylenchus destructor]
MDEFDQYFDWNDYLDGYQLSDDNMTPPTIQDVVHNFDQSLESSDYQPNDPNFAFVPRGSASVDIENFESHVNIGVVPGYFAQNNAPNEFESEEDKGAQLDQKKRAWADVKGRRTEKKVMASNNGVDELEQFKKDHDFERIERAIALFKQTKDLHKGRSKQE